MIISRTPLRMSFAGGGSDIPAFYRQYGGAVVSTAIDKYVYITVNKKFDSGIRVAYAKNEEVSEVLAIEHPLVRATLEHLEINGGIEITSVADIPSKGTGLGSSSAFTVGLLNVLNAYQGRYISNAKLASDSCYIEIECCKEPIGKQDQYASAFGGFNLIEFHQDDSVDVSPIICNPETLQQLEANILTFYTGITRNASLLLQQQIQAVNESAVKQKNLRHMVELTYQLRDELQRNNLHAFGEILHASWQLKKNLTANISTDAIDMYYQKALANGAIGGKILGAGAGGFLMFYAPVATHAAIKQALQPLRHIPMRFERLGSSIIFYHI